MRYGIYYTINYRKVKQVFRKKHEKKAILSLIIFEKGCIVFGNKSSPRPDALRGAENRPGVRPGGNRTCDRKEHPT